MANTRAERSALSFRLPHAWATTGRRLTIAYENDPRILHRFPHLVDATHASVLTGFKTVHGVSSHVRLPGEFLGAPIEGCTPHATLIWLHVVFLSPDWLDSKSVMILSLTV